MTKTFEKQAAEIIAALFAANKNKDVNVIIKQTGRTEEVLTLQIPDFLQKSHDFSKTLLDLGVLPSVIFSENKTRRKSVKNKLAYISYIDRHIVSMSSKELKELLNEVDQQSEKISDVAPFIWNVFLTWNNLHPKIRSHRNLSEDMVGGYLKQFKTYSHREILDMVETYGKWATAYYRMVDDDAYKPIWFHPTTLSGLLRSSKLFPNHLECGWKQLIREKQIPAEYAEDSSNDPYAKLNPNNEISAEDEHRKKIEYWANDYKQYGEDVMDPVIMERYGEEIKQKAAEL